MNFIILFFSQNPVRLYLITGFKFRKPHKKTTNGKKFIYHQTAETIDDRGR
jgi:hypothetical protein